MAEKAERDMSRVERILDLLACVPTKLGLTYPRLDADMMASLPFKRPVTIVSDTSAITQGALDFVARHLHPAARIKIPAIAHMEIVNQADRFLTQRRALKRNAASTLYERFSSQGSQRVLLRLELHSEVEIERTAVVSEPLRSAFTQDRDIGEGNLSAPVRSFCDRLILEVARQHQAYAAPGHQIFLLTSDQGLARMAMAEGIPPMFYMAPVASDVLGTVLTGTLFSPFSDELHHVPLVKVLWELAAGFGNVRLKNPAKDQYVEVATMGESLTWAPFHSREDLLWVTSSTTSPLPVADRSPVARSAVPRSASRTDESGHGRQASAIVRGPTTFRFMIERLLEIIALLGEKGRPVKSLPQLEGLSTKTLDEYRRLLESGGLVEGSTEQWKPTDRLAKLYASLLASDLKAATSLFAEMPSFAAFLTALRTEEVVRPASTAFPTRSLTSYESLAEILCEGAPLLNEGFFATPNDPPARDFARLAIERYESLAKGDRLVAVGAWLEELIRKDGIHPIYARARLTEAWSSGLLQVVAEGSTTDTKHESRTLRILQIDRGRFKVQLVHLYRGDFLITDKSSTSFRIEEAVK